MAERVVDFLCDAGSERHARARASASVSTLECQARQAIPRAAERRGNSEVKRLVAPPPVILRQRPLLAKHDGKSAGQAQEADFQPHSAQITRKSPVHGRAEVLGCPR